MSEDTGEQVPGVVPVMRELDFSKLPEGSSFVQRMVLTLKLSTGDFPIEMSDEGLYAAIEEWEDENKRPEKRRERIAIPKHDKLGKKMAAAGYRGPWPAVREVWADSRAEEEHARAEAERFVSLCWFIVGKAMPPIRDAAGVLVEGQAARVSFLKSKGVTDEHACAIAKELRSLKAIEIERQDQEDADFFGED